MPTTTTPDEQALDQLRKIQRRCPRFYGIRPSPDGVHWTAAVRTANGKEIIIGTEFESESAAWYAYRSSPHRCHRKVEEPESPEMVDTLLALAASYPVIMETSASLFRSTMCPGLSNWERAMNVDHHCEDFETTTKRR